MMSASSHRYRFRLAASPPPRFAVWFPDLAVREADDDQATVVIEGLVADSCQLAGIVSAICHRNGEILSVEQLESVPQTRH